MKNTFSLFQSCVYVLKLCNCLCMPYIIPWCVYSLVVLWLYCSLYSHTAILSAGVKGGHSTHSALLATVNVNQYSQTSYREVRFCWKHTEANYTLTSVTRVFNTCLKSRLLRLWRKGQWPVLAVLFLSVSRFIITAIVNYWQIMTVSLIVCVIPPDHAKENQKMYLKCSYIQTSMLIFFHTLKCGAATLFQWCLPAVFFRIVVMLLWLVLWADLYRFGNLLVISVPRLYGFPYYRDVITSLQEITTCRTHSAFNFPHNNNIFIFLF